MSPSPTRKNQWTLSEEAFDRLLAAFGPSREEAAERYEGLRVRLVRYFIWERCAFPEERADEAFNRVARRLAEGEPVQNVEHYTSGVARLLAKESVAEEIRQHRAYSGWASMRNGEGTAAPTGEYEAACLEACLNDVLSAEERDFLLQYYEGDRQIRIQSRQRMAARLGIGLNALRNRALRLREKLESCLRDRLQEPPREGSA
ncbi:MAG: hypothetical protein ABI972_12450 [Acidobacteriota bacterium]